MLIANIPTDLILVSLFLVLNLVIGLVVGRKVKTLTDFAVGKKDFSTGALTATTAATWMGGAFMFFTLQNMYNNGLQYIFVALAGSLCLLFMGQVLAARMQPFLQNLSVAEAMGNLYGPVVRILTAATGIVKTVGSIAIQFQVIGKILTTLLGVEGNWATVVAATVVIIYAAFGGIRSVTITDILQFIAFIISLLMLSLVIWRHVDDPTRISHIIAKSNLFSWKDTIGWNSKTLSMFGLFLYFLLPSLSPSIFQRIVMAKDVSQVKAVFTYAACIRTLIVVSIAYIAVLLLVEPTSTDSNLVTHIISYYSYPGLKAIVAIGIIGMAMASSDSDLNAAAVLASHDLFKNTKNPLLTAKFASLTIGCFALLVALRNQNLLDILLITGSVYVPIVSPPLLMAIFGFRSKTTPALIGIAAGFITVAIWGYFGNIKDSIIPAMLVNLACFMSSHYVLRVGGGGKEMLEIIH